MFLFNRNIQEINKVFRKIEKSTLFRHRLGITGFAEKCLANRKCIVEFTLFPADCFMNFVKGKLKRIL